MRMVTSSRMTTSCTNSEVLMSGIYVILNCINGKKYVGQTNDIDRRRREHIRSLQSGSHYNSYLQRSFAKYGIDNFLFVILERCSIDLLDDREMYWIALSKSNLMMNGYNMNSGGNRLTEADRLRFSIRVSSMDLNTIKNIKKTLSDDLGKSSYDVAKQYGVSLNSIHHITSLASHSLILSERNYLIKNRNVIHDKRVDKTALRMYRQGYSYQEIADEIDKHMRTAIRIIKRITNEYDDRQRINYHNRMCARNKRIINTCRNMGMTDKRIAEITKLSRATVNKIRNDKAFNKVSYINEIRFMPKHIKINRRID